jgi:hypothetical protein
VRRSGGRVGLVGQRRDGAEVGVGMQAAQRQGGGR